jgi:hypothetical protein
MPARRDLTGQRFGRLVAVAYLGDLRWRVKCDCGNTKLISTNHLVDRPHNAGCGCFAGTHGHTKKKNSYRTPTYISWMNMKDRCYNPNYKGFPRYGGRGIKVCDRWRDSFENFLADLGERPLGRTLDRINNNGDYEFGNCRWATKSEQNYNRR